MTKSESKKRRIIPVLILLLAAGGAWTYFERRPQEKHAAPVYYGNVDIRDVTLAFRVPGRLSEMRKNEGDQVAADEVVAVLEKAPFELQLAQVKAAADVALAQVKTVEAGARREDISQARAVLAERKAASERAQNTLERTQRLEASGAATTQALIDARAAADQTRSGVDAAQATLNKLINGARSEEIIVAHSQAAQAQAAVAIAELNLADTELQAKTAGVVVIRAVEPGAMVQAGSPALVVAFEDPVWVRAYAAEKDLAALQPGRRVLVYSDARAGEPYTGQVGYVSPQAEFTPKNVETEELRSSLVYRFRVIVKDHGGGLRQGMPVTIRLEAKAAPSAKP
jgi:HlyD family secretion protein